MKTPSHVAHVAHVLAVIDFSPASDEALRQAHGYARMTNSKLSVLHVVPDVMRANPLFPAGAMEDVNVELALERRALDDLAEKVKDITGRFEDDAEVAIRVGAVDVSVIRYAEEHNVDVIVAGATGRTGLARIWLGSTAERIVRYAHGTVLVARASQASGKVLVATDLSKAAEHAVAVGVEEAKRRGAALHLAYVTDTTGMGWAAMASPLGAFSVPVADETMAAIRKHAEGALREVGGPNATIHVVEGVPKQQIVMLAESVGVELLVVGTHGRTGLARMALGSVAEAVVRAAPCSVLVVR